MSLQVNPYLSTGSNYTMNFGANKNNANNSTSTGNSLGSYMPEGLELALTKALEEISELKDGSPVTITDIIAYLKNLENAFTEKVEKDLKALGLTDFDFQIALDPKKENEQAITVSAKNEETKKLVESYFKQNPGIVEEFRKIQALKNLEKNLSPENEVDKLKGTNIRTIKANYQAQALDIFFNSTTDTGTSLLADFSGGQTTFSSGIDYFV
ncbi:hypothetical protein [Desulfovibrio litoralis]|uniref:Uncharacterized protein n=1 Tax=Desulfovibrio litoralis DSM 11393 TaxID=1121455 RepID=A0A1M7SWK1_9BACT|nr:hypothetical protein [Desulfovibrio litoralis]SHN62754.1 hypothetical protein SAMN02745728_01299 [Desulfovibrio litoralis DSM 11393]